jgi:hypothetical protein
MAKPGRQVVVLDRLRRELKAEAARQGKLLWEVEAEAIAMWLEAQTQKKEVEYGKADS